MPKIEKLRVSVFEIPTDGPESDGTIEWQSTTLVVVELEAGGRTGLGYTYASRAAATVIRHDLAAHLDGAEVHESPKLVADLDRAVRNVGRPGVAACAISALDVALWDVRAKLLDLPLVTLLGEARPSVPIYGSGGFTSYTEARLCEQLGGWVEQGIARVKMKVGRHPDEDDARVHAARQAIGPKAALFVDANGAYERKQALDLAAAYVALGVSWFEEPVSSDDLPGLRLLRNRAPAGMQIAAGEYGYDPRYFLRLLSAEAVDVLQADATRCGGVTGFLRAAALCDAFGVPLSAHTAPALHTTLCCAAPRVQNLEYFHDHVRIEGMLFDGVPAPRQGSLAPLRDRPGLGLTLRGAEAKRFEV